jgi:hypothetical protein
LEKSEFRQQEEKVGKGDTSFIRRSPQKNNGATDEQHYERDN